MTLEPVIILVLIGFFSIISQLVAHQLKLPAILFLLLTGIALGPVTGVLQPDILFGELLFPIVSLSVAIILFEGSMTLHFSQIREVGGVIQRLVSIGAVATWLIISAITNRNAFGEEAEVAQVALLRPGAGDEGAAAVMALHHAHLHQAAQSALHGAEARPHLGGELVLRRQLVARHPAPGLDGRQDVFGDPPMLGLGVIHLGARHRLQPASAGRHAHSYRGLLPKRYLRLILPSSPIEDFRFIAEILRSSSKKAAPLARPLTAFWAAACLIAPHRAVQQCRLRSQIARG